VETSLMVQVEETWRYTTMIDWEAARKKLTLEYCYDHFPDVRKIVDEEFTVDAVVETWSTHPPGFYFGQTDESTPTEEPIVETVVVIEDPKVYLSDYIPEQYIPKYSRVQINGSGEPWNFQGREGYVWLKPIYADILRVALPRLYKKCPRHVFENLLKLVMGDASAWSGGHTYHNDKTSSTFDINYFTFGENLTHCSHDKDLLENIWLDDEHQRINPKMFDGETNYLFLKMIHDIFPESRILVSSGIKGYLSRYGYVGFLLADDNSVWNHHLHCHIELGKRVNWDYRF